MAAQTGNGSEDYEKAILWVPDPTSPKGWIRRKVWSQPEEPRRKPPLGFHAAVRRREPDGSHD